MNKILNIQNRAQMKTHFRAIFVGYTLRFVNENPNNWLIIGSGNFGMNQLESVVDCYPFSQFLNSLRNRILTHCHPPARLPRKIKSGREPTERDPALRASCELYGLGEVESTEQRSGAKTCSTGSGATCHLASLDGYRVMSDLVAGVMCWCAWRLGRCAPSTAGLLSESLRGLPPAPIPVD